MVSEVLEVSSRMRQERKNRMANSRGQRMAPNTMAQRVVSQQQLTQY